MVDILQPLSARVAKGLILGALKTGKVVFSGHALQELKKDKLTTVDAENVMRGGVVNAPEWEHGEWRYHVWTQKIVVVVAFNSETEVAVVTAWRV